MKKTRTFVQLDGHKRDRIEAMLDSDILQKDIAKILEVNKSTISREVAERKKNDGKYVSTVASHKALVKRETSK